MYVTLFSLLYFCRWDRFLCTFNGKYENENQPIENGNELLRLGTSY